MTVEELAQRLELRVAVGGEALSREVAGGYCGDLLSWVMSRAQSGDVWFTVMGNVNSIAVAMLATWPASCCARMRRSMRTRARVHKKKGLPCW